MAHFSKLSRPTYLTRLLCAVAVVGAQLCAASMAHAQAAQTAAEFPNKAIKIIVGFAPGGGSDFIARIVAQRLTAKLGQTVYVENRPGAGGNLGAEIALRSAGDGYTLFLAATSYTVNANLYKLPFDPVKDITAVARLASGPFVIATNPGTQIKTLKELVERAKKEPGKLTYASSGSGSITHIATEYFLSVAGVEALHIPYKGTSPALTDTISGTVQFMFGTVASTVPHVKSGKLQGLAVTTKDRLGALPDLPTVIESGYPGFDVAVWHGLIGPKGIPKDIVDKLNKAVLESLSDPATAEQLATDGLTPAKDSPEAFGQLIELEVKRWGALVKSRGITLK
jgi:tripartite-type tricarboxylate transporter receptor subunit TctC